MDDFYVFGGIFGAVFTLIFIVAFVLIITSTNTAYFLTFQTENGERTEFNVDGRVYGMSAEGDRGQLSFQGTRFLGFARQQDKYSGGAT